MKRPSVATRVRRVHKRALTLYDAAKRLIEAKGCHARFYAHRDMVEIVRKIENYKKRRVVTSK